MTKQPYVGSSADMKDRPQVLAAGYYVTSDGRRRKPLRNNRGGWIVLMIDGYFKFPTFSEAIAKADKLTRGNK